jgi:cytochrome c-type biogenesis protein CcmH
MRAAALATAVALALALAVASPARAQPATWSVTAFEDGIMCPVCNTLLNNSQSAAAERIREQIQQRHQQGWTQQQVRDELVSQYGEEILASPPRHGFDLLAWLVPAAVLLGGAAVALALAMAWARGRGGGPSPAAPAADPGMDARIDADLAREEP